jgi:hypothetical protein
VTTAHRRSRITRRRGWITKSKWSILLRPHLGGKAASDSLVRVRPQIYAATLSRALLTMLSSAKSPPCAMSPVIVEPVVGIFPPSKPFVTDEPFCASEESLSPTGPVCFAR